MSNNQKKYLPINYTKRDFEGIRSELLEIAERFYPETFQDFSEASFGAMMLDAVAYVGDQLHFYLDYNVNEAFLDSSFQFSNILRHGSVLGYKSRGRPSTYGEVALYIEVPATDSDLGPDTRYIPIMTRGSVFRNQSGQSFTLLENVDFNNPSNAIVVSKVSPSTGAPSHYAIKAYGNVVSGRLVQKRIKVGNYQKFKSVALGDPSIAEIISVYDSEGNQYYEVDYLSQDMIFKEVANTNYKNDNVPSLLKPFLVSRKFIVQNTNTTTILQFGSGEAAANDVVANPQEVAIDVFGKNYVTDVTFDPTRLSKNSSYGIVPVDTTLFVTYRTSPAVNSNSSAGTLTGVVSANLKFENRDALSNNLISSIQRSVEVTNEGQIIGDTSAPSKSEIKRQIMDTFPTQNRAVTQSDYENIVYRMPKKFGSIKRCSIQRDPDSKKRNLNLYVVSEDPNEHLTKTNNTIKQNVKTWLNNYRMINDTIDILDPYIINYGIEFSIKCSSPSKSEQILAACISKISETMSGDGISFIGVTSVKIVNKAGGQYSSTSFNVNKNMSSDGTTLLCPQNAIFEIKFPSVDITGRVA